MSVVMHRSQKADAELKTTPPQSRVTMVTSLAENVSSFVVLESQG